MSNIREYGPYLTCDCGKASKDPSITEDLDLEYTICDHIWECIKHGDDVKMFGALKDRVVIPMRRGLVDGLPLNVQVRVHTNEKIHGMSPVAFTGVTWQAAEGLQTITHVDESEGRWAIRGPILEVLRAAYYTIKDPCRAANHNGRAYWHHDREKKDLDSTSWPVLAATYTMIQEGICWRCAAKLADHEDLAPEL